jgi:hypothetical protein
MAFDTDDDLNRQDTRSMWYVVMDEYMSIDCGLLHPCVGIVCCGDGIFECEILHMDVFGNIDILSI